MWDGSGPSDVEYFLFNFENVVSVETEGEKKGRPFMTYQRDGAFQYYFHRFSVLGILPEEAANYDFIKEVFKKRFGRRRDAQAVI